MTVASVDQRTPEERVRSIRASLCDLQAIGVPFRVLAPILAHIDPSRCVECGRVEATEEDWKADFEGGERDDLCWGYAANCPADYEESIRVIA